MREYMGVRFCGLVSVANGLVFRVAKYDELGVTDIVFEWQVAMALSSENMPSPKQSFYGLEGWNNFYA